MKASKALKQDTKLIFAKKGTCSRTFFYILNQEFGHPMELEERAIDPLAGGIMQQGYQCGMLWGASMATGAEAYRRCTDCGKAMVLTLKATQHIMASFSARTHTPDCYDITSVDWTSKREMRKYMLSGKFLKCFFLADKWAPEAIRAAREGLELDQDGLPGETVTCASEVLKRMGATEAEMVMVSGFAGGLGLSGNACGALGAAIWLRALRWCRNNPENSGFKNPDAERILKAFLEASEYELLCCKLTAKKFNSVEEHTEFIKGGGCGSLIEMLAHA
ncbi:MAG: C-GCAxxG-C-C family protein [Bacteroidales bacterium]|nr:C-GCAxxG-C-C family protein [Bacteroidales bacterium]